MSVLPAEGCRFESSVPVVVIGAGACGLTAALAARDAGVEVLVLERDRRPLGSTAMSLGAICAVDSAAQRRKGVADDPDLFIADVMAKTEGRADPALTRVIARESGPTVDWLTERHAVPLELDFAWTGLGHSKPRLHLPPGRNGEELVNLLVAASERAGAELLTEARVIDLFAGADGRVRGLRLQRPDGSREELGCEALVLATCGFGGNRALVAEHIPEMANARYFGHEGNQGDGILWGIALGAAVGDMTAYQGLGTLADPQSVVVPHPLLIEGGILVNAEGVRFTHELANISGMCVPVLAQPRGIAWVIFDRTRHESTLRHSVEQRQLVEIGAIRQAPTLAGLELACQLPAGSLERELAATEAARGPGGVDRFGRSFAGLAPLAPPFYAVRVTGALFHTQGGLEVDADARVLRADGTALPNLFAGGGAARSISGPAVTGYLPAVGLCMAVTLGRLAGRGAARLVTGAAAAPAAARSA
jgi:fumarate reductase flavoprotein subunit